MAKPVDLSRDAAPTPRLSVLCVDDNALIADALRRRFEPDEELTWVGVISDGPTVYEGVMNARPDIVLMDIDMPDVDTFAVVERLSAESQQIRVIMFSGHVSPAYIERALDCGAWGYLSKNDDVTSLIEGIKRVGRGEMVFSEEVEAVRRYS